MNPKKEKINKRKASDPKESINSFIDKPSDNKSFLISPTDLHKKFIFPKERELNTNFYLSFKELYFYHVKIIEEKTRLKIKNIYYFLIIALIFFVIGYFERIFSYIITMYYPIIWTREDYKLDKDYFWKKWGTYWTFFSGFIFFDIHKDEVLKIIPFYFIIKSIFLTILYMPGFTAAVDIYDGFLKDYLFQIGQNFQNKDYNDTLANDLKKIVKVKKE